jgi:hypothetical protein
MHALKTTELTTGNISAAPFCQTGELFTTSAI